MITTEVNLQGQAAAATVKGVCRHTEQLAAQYYNPHWVGEVPQWAFGS
jgi:hypothetical protein